MRTHMIKRMMQTAGVASAMVLGGWSVPAQASIIGDVVSLNWRADNTNNGTLASDGTTQSGVLDSVHWTTTTMTANNVLTSNLKNNSGNATTIDIRQNASTQDQKSSPLTYTGTNDDLLMLGTGLGWRGNAGLADTNRYTLIQASEIPYAEYDVIIYVARNSTNHTIGFSLGSMTTPTAERFIQPIQQPVTPPVTWTESTATASGDAIAGNYIRFTGLTASSFDIYARTSLGSGSGRSVISGIQIVQIIPEPGSLALLAVGSLLMLPRRAQRG